MTDTSIQDQINKFEAVTLATSVPLHDAVTTLLDEGRQGAYSARATVDVSDPKDVRLTTSVKNGDDLFADVVLHGPSVAKFDASSPVTHVNSALTLMDGRGQLVRLEEHSSAANAQSMLATGHSKDSDGSGSGKIETIALERFKIGANQQTAIGVNDIFDAKGNEHTALDMTVTSHDNATSITDTFVFKDNIKSADMSNPQLLTPDHMLGVIHSSLTRAGDEATFKVEIQPARAVDLPHLPVAPIQNR